MKYIGLIILVLFTCLSVAQTQKGAIEGMVDDKETGEPLPFVNILLLDSGKTVLGTTSDFDGVYRFNELDSGDYKIKFRYIGYKDIILSVKVQPNFSSKLDASLKSSPICILPIYQLPSFSIDVNDNTVERVYKREELQHLASF